VKKKQYLRKRQLAERYQVHVRSIDRMAATGRLPHPIYLPGSTLPMWDADEIEAVERSAVRTPEEPAS
jgi:predicted DNA-binding transcriptional regulator AlpA